MKSAKKRTETGAQRKSREARELRSREAVRLLAPYLTAQLRQLARRIAVPIRSLWRWRSGDAAPRPGDYRRLVRACASAAEAA